MQTYDEITDTGVGWLGEIPSEWKVQRVGSVFKQRNEKVSDKDYEPLSVTKKGIVPQLDDAAKTNDGDNRKKVLKGDFVINSRSDRKGSGGISPLDGSVSLINTILMDGKLESRYTHHLMRSYPFQEEFYRWGQGIVADLWSTNYQRMKAIALPVPPEDIQIKIANFLDDETAKIDNLIAKQERLLELLEEKRRTTIAQAIIRGVDPNIQLKGTDIAWLSRIPVSTNARKLKSVLTLNTGGAWGGDPIGDGTDTIVLRSTEQTSDGGWKLIDPAERQIDVAEYNKTKLEPGDLIVTKSSGSELHIGKTSIVDDRTKGFSYSNFMQRLRLNNDENPKFYWYFLNSTVAREQYNYYSNSTSGLANLNSSIFNNLIFVYHEAIDQDKIVEYLDTVCQELDIIKQKITTQISLLRERRTSIISHAVTGKLKV